eukprot:525397_1
MLTFLTDYLNSNSCYSVTTSSLSSTQYCRPVKFVCMDQARSSTISVEMVGYMARKCLPRRPARFPDDETKSCSSSDEEYDDEFEASSSDDFVSAQSRNSAKKFSNFLTLSDDLIAHLAAFLECRDINRLVSVCQRLYRLTDAALLNVTRIGERWNTRLRSVRRLRKLIKSRKLRNLVSIDELFDEHAVKLIRPALTHCSQLTKVVISVDWDISLLRRPLPNLKEIAFVWSSNAIFDRAAMLPNLEVLRISFNHWDKPSKDVRNFLAPEALQTWSRLRSLTIRNALSDYDFNTLSDSSFTAIASHQNLVTFKSQLHMTASQCRVLAESFPPRMRHLRIGFGHRDFVAEPPIMRQLGSNFTQLEEFGLNHDFSGNVQPMMFSQCQSISFGHLKTLIWGEFTGIKFLKLLCTHSFPVLTSMSICRVSYDTFEFEPTSRVKPCEEAFPVLSYLKIGWGESVTSPHFWKRLLLDSRGRPKFKSLDILELGRVCKGDFDVKHFAPLVSQLREFRVRDDYFPRFIHPPAADWPELRYAPFSRMERIGNIKCEAGLVEDMSTISWPALKYMKLEFNSSVSPAAAACLAQNMPSLKKVVFDDSSDLPSITSFMNKYASVCTIQCNSWLFKHVQQSGCLDDGVRDLLEAWDSE